jgi:predicted MFS family arabinose efflux permease
VRLNVYLLLPANVVYRSGMPRDQSTLIAACVSGFLFQFDFTALSAALPDIASSLSAQVADQAWIINVYSLALIFAPPPPLPSASPCGKSASHSALR